MSVVEFPKWLHFEGEPSVLVKNAAEEADVLAAREPAPEPEPKAEVEAEQPADAPAEPEAPKARKKPVRKPRP